MSRFVIVKRNRETFYETKVSAGDGEAYQGAIEAALKSFEKRSPDLEIVNWSVRTKLILENQDFDIVQIYADQILSIDARKRKPTRLKAQKPTTTKKKK
jgi:hypothetical protein